MQNIPLPLSGMTPVRARRSSRRSPRPYLVALAVSASVLAASVGGVLIVVPPTVTAALHADRIQVGSMDLVRVGGSVTTGDLFRGGASYALVEGAGSARAAAAWTVSGTLSTGECDMHSAGWVLIADCTFTGPAGRITSVDVLDVGSGTGWKRTYADGVHVTVAVSPDGAAVPVPFPIGHSP